MKTRHKDREKIRLANQNVFEANRDRTSRRLNEIFSKGLLDCGHENDLKNLSIKERNYYNCWVISYKKYHNKTLCYRCYLKRRKK